MARYEPDNIFAPPDVIRTFAENVQTPFYLYNRKGITDSIEEIKSWFSWAKGYRNYFPLRENINPTILQLLSGSGTGVSVCNLMELKVAQRCEFTGSQILYVPTRQDPEAEALAKSLSAVWLINSLDLIPQELPHRLLLRYHPCDLPMTPMQLRSIGRSKNGFNTEQLLESLKNPSIQGECEVGLALQVTSYNVACGAWANKADALLRLSEEIYEKTKVTIAGWYLGEGPGLPYRPQAETADPAEESARVREIYQKIPEDRRPALMTGISKRLLEPHGLLISKVLEQRSSYRTFLVIDAGMPTYIRPMLKQAYRHISILGRNEIEGRKLYTVVGELPDEIDRFDQKGRMLPIATSGDYCVIHDVGCGARSMPLLYGFSIVPAEYLYLPDGTIKQIAFGRSAEEVAEFLTAW